MKNILLLTPAFRPNVGGVEVHLNDLTEYLRGHGYYTYVLTYQPITSNLKGVGVEKLKNLEVHRYSWISGNYFNWFVSLPPVFNFIYLTPYLGLRALLFMLKNKEKVDVIHAIGLSSAFIARFLKAIFNKPAVMSTETLFNFRKGSFFYRVSRWVLSGMDIVLAQSEESRVEIMGLGISENRIKVFHHWINQDIFTPQDKRLARKKLNWKEMFTILYVGRLIPEKGVRLTIEAVRQLGGNVQLYIVGDDGPELSYVSDSVQKHTNIHFVGKIQHDNLPPYYTAADLFIYPALYKEDMSYAILDALSCGTPVINTNLGSGIYRLPTDVCYIVKPEINDIVEKVRFLVRHTSKLKTMSKRAAIFAKKFGPSLAKIITEVYDSLVPNDK